MRKVFVSVPMKGRSSEDIKYSILKMHHLAEIYTNEKLELIDSYVIEEPPMNCNVSLWYLSKSLEKLAIADVFIGIEDFLGCYGCQLERMAANYYKIESYIVNPKIILN